MAAKQPPKNVKVLAIWRLHFTYLTRDVYLALGSLSAENFDPVFKTFQSAYDEYTKFFFRNSVIIRKDIADAFEVGIKHINNFRTLSQHCRNEQIRYNDLEETAGFETHVIANIESLKLIHDELNTGDEYGIHKIICLVRSYFDSLDVI